MNSKEITFCIKQKQYIMIELTIRKKLMLLRQVKQMSVIFFIVSIFFEKTV